MNNLKIWKWNKKPRTMIRFIKNGDIFCFTFDKEKYYFGRIISKFIVGHVAEILNFISESPSIDENKIKSAKSLIPPFIKDSYLLFDKKYESDSDWQIIGHQENYKPTNMDDVYFSYGAENSRKKIDIWGNEYSITEKESMNIPILAPYSSYHIKKILEKLNTE